MQQGASDVGSVTPWHLDRREMEIQAAPKAPDTVAAVVEARDGAY